MMYADFSEWPVKIHGVDLRDGEIWILKEARDGLKWFEAKYYAEQDKKLLTVINNMATVEQMRQGLPVK